ncbi:hypothetical protein L6164_000559 [Bauhinia variegata]|uniref:Uncharacterized protein n=1 Tax=Bauhinia variegata TaxID=167791 RepID=A0ACB9Q6U2_BAUVA|nr:hypothetical protein L6164_000559 [Bauhinia variegata]
MAEDHAVKFFGVTGSPVVCRVKIALELKGVEYKFFEEDLKNKSELLLKYNPVHKKVPVLVHNEKPIAESLLILEYIDETWKSGYPILPAEPYDRALARFWSKFIDDKLWPSIRKAAWSVGDEKEREKGIEESCEALQILENELKDKKFFGGDKFGFVDIAAVFVAFWVPVIQQVAGLNLFSAEKFPKLEKWIQEFTSLPVVKESLPPKQRLEAFFTALFQSLAAAK